MQTIRLIRMGRKKSPFFRLVLTDKKASPKAGYTKVLGWFNPLTKEQSYDVDAIRATVSMGTQMSERAAKLLFAQTKDAMFQQFFSLSSIIRPKKQKE